MNFAMQRVYLRTNLDSKIVLLFYSHEQEIAALGADSAIQTLQELGILSVLVATRQPAKTSLYCVNMIMFGRVQTNYQRKANKLYACNLLPKCDRAKSCFHWN